MEPADRLAAFLAGELSADERQAVEAALVRDAGLRAQLDAMRRADRALDGEAPTALPDGARDRLLQALQPVLDAELGRSPGATPANDELAARRHTTRRSDTRGPKGRRSWMAAVGGVAAAGVAVAVLGPTFGGSGDHAGTDLATTADEESADGREGGAAADDSGTAIAPIGPTLLGSDRSIDEAAAAELLAAGELDAVVDQGLTRDDALALGSAWAMAFGVESGDVSTLDAVEDTRAADDGGATHDGEAEEAPAANQDAPASEPESIDRGRLDEHAGRQDVPAPGAAAELGSADVQILGEVDQAAREDVARCLDNLLEGGGVLVPALAELVTFDGEPAIAFGLVGVAPDETVTRREVWVLDRQTCDVRYFGQG